ncbi:endo-1,4-D-glucanase [Acidovorax carolinensis]|uniref:cellulase n=1 Tax=Acidovorax carolinensis TaxID=553814 RepID=A0A240U7G4_9BURK|nr:endo-1,4-D-glucanase [Acidovorax carolinensis]
MPGATSVSADAGDCGGGAVLAPLEGQGAGLRRRSLAGAGLLWPLLAAAAPRAAPQAALPCPAWPLWQAFVQRFVQADGRVIDDQHQTRYTTSEGQAYALFFCLVANERGRFDTLLRWTERHLADGDLTARLPGWRWGRHDSGEWSLVDANAASDADLWLAYTLFEAARLWDMPSYGLLAQALLARIEATELVRLPGLGWMLLPGPLGFQTDAARWRFNPSYLPVHQLRYFASLRADRPWREVADNTLAMLRAVAPHGLVPDWVEYSEAQGWHATATSPALGSYDAIRSYLWAGLLHGADPARSQLLRLLGGMRRWLAAGHAQPPQKVRTSDGTGTGVAPPGFSAALLPYLQALGAKEQLAAQLTRVVLSTRAAGEGRAANGCPASRFATALLGHPPTYYDQVLALFGQGALEGRYRFGPTGALLPRY